MRPEAFSIRLLPETERGPDDQRLGEIRVGSFVERFAVYPFAGSIEAVAASWSEALRGLLGGATAVGLPTASNMTWLLYRLGDRIFVRQMLMLPGVGPKLRRGRVVSIPSYKPNRPDGGQISEWVTSVEAVSTFVAA